MEVIPEKLLEERKSTVKLFLSAERVVVTLTWPAGMALGTEAGGVAVGVEMGKEEGVAGWALKPKSESDFGVLMSSWAGL